MRASARLLILVFAGLAFALPALAQDYPIAGMWMGSYYDRDRKTWISMRMDLREHGTYFQSITVNSGGAYSYTGRWSFEKTRSWLTWTSDDISPESTKDPVMGPEGTRHISLIQFEDDGDEMVFIQRNLPTFTLSR